jgi:hypothetical protein
MVDGLHQTATVTVDTRSKNVQISFAKLLEFWKRFLVIEAHCARKHAGLNLTSLSNYVVRASALRNMVRAMERGLGEPPSSKHPTSSFPRVPALTRPQPPPPASPPRLRLPILFPYIRPWTWRQHHFDHGRHYQIALCFTRPDVH